MNACFTTFAFLLNIHFLIANITVKGFTGHDIQEAIDVAEARGGDIVTCPDGEYEIRNTIHLKDNVQLRGQGKNTVLKKCSRFASRVSNKISKDDCWIYVEDSSVFKCGDSVIVFFESMHPVYAWVTEIVKILPNALHVKDKAPFKISLSLKPFVFCSFPVIYCREVNNTSVHDLSIDGNRKENPVINTWWDSCIGCWDASEIDIVNVTIHDAAGDGISLNNAHQVNIVNCEIISSARLGIHIGTGSRYTYVGDSKIVNSGLAFTMNMDGIYLCYDAMCGLYENNVITKNRKAGISIGRGDANNVFLNNKITDNYMGLLFREDSFNTTNIVFSQNQIEYNHTWDLFMEKPAHHIFMDVWPEKRSIHPESSFLYYLDLSQDSWLKFQ